MCTNLSTRSLLSLAVRALLAGLVMSGILAACTPATSDAPPFATQPAPDAALSTVAPTATDLPPTPTLAPADQPQGDTAFRLPTPSVAPTETPTRTPVAPMPQPETPIRPNANAQPTLPEAEPAVTESDAAQPVPWPTVMAALPLPTPPTSTYSETVRVPILMYHYISDPPPDADKYRVDLSVSPPLFERQIQYLADNGYTPIDLYDISLAIARKQPLPDKPVVLTFDDGYLDNYENAFPVLQKYGFTATFFVITGFVEQNAAPYMTWPMLEEMSRAGMRIESHTVSHPQLSGMSAEDQRYQIETAQQMLTERLGYAPRYLCYPGGFYDETTQAVLEELGLWGAVTTQSGKWHDFDSRFEWNRLRIRNTTFLPDFAALLDQY